MAMWIAVPNMLFQFFRERGFLVYEPSLWREEHTSEERMQDNGVFRSLIRKVIGPAILKEYLEVPKIPNEQADYYGEYLLQNSTEAFMLALTSERFYYDDGDVPLRYLCICRVPLLDPSFGIDEERNWKLQVADLIPWPSSERFNLARIEGGEDGLMMEIHDDGDLYATLESDSEVLQQLLDSLRAVFPITIILEEYDEED